MNGMTASQHQEGMVIVPGGGMGVVRLPWFQDARNCTRGCSVFPPRLYTLHSSLAKIENTGRSESTLIQPLSETPSQR